MLHSSFLSFCVLLAVIQLQDTTGANIPDTDLGDNRASNHLLPENTDILPENTDLTGNPANTDLNGNPANTDILPANTELHGNRAGDSTHPKLLNTNPEEENEAPQQHPLLTNEDPDDFTPSPPTGIMSDFTKEFLKVADDEDLSGDLFNKEPFYYDTYYDSLYDDKSYSSDDDSIGDSVDDSEEATGLEDPMGIPEAQSIKRALDLTLMGPNLQQELGLMLQQLTNVSLRTRRHHGKLSDHEATHPAPAEIKLNVEGSCPPPVHSMPPGLCAQPPCTSHMMCYPQKMCCFNGCTYTCSSPIKPPPVIDWVEDSVNRRPILDPLNPRLPLRFESSPLYYGTGGGETIVLPGGCTLSAQKYSELKKFMTAESIQDCLCSNGEVVCEVKSTP